MIYNIILLAVSIFLVVKGATIATKYSSKLAQSLGMSKYVIGFILVAFISILPETIISIDSALSGIPEFGLGTLFGSNVADLTLVVAIIIFYARRGIRVEKKMLKDVGLYPLFLLLPLLFGVNGFYSRLEGALMIMFGIFFYFLMLRKAKNSTQKSGSHEGRLKNFLILLFSLGLLLLGSHFAVKSSVFVAQAIGVRPIIIGIVFVGLGTTLPELFYALKSVKSRKDGLAVSDIMGTVLADATLVVGVIALIKPFYFPVQIVFLTGISMVVCTLILMRFMQSERTISAREAYILFGLWIIYVLAEFLLSVEKQLTF